MAKLTAMKTNLSGTVLLALLALNAPPAHVHASPPQYSVTILSPDGEAIAINDAGQVTGNISGQAVVWNAGTPTFLDSPGGGFNSTYGHAINALGQVVGTASDNGGSTEAVLWNGTTATVVSSGSQAWAIGINATGKIAGDILGSNTAVVWNGTTPTMLASFAGSGGDWAYGINSSGQVAGSSGGYAVIWNRTTPTPLGGLGVGGSTARAINDAGVAVGDSFLPGNLDHAVVWNGTTPTDLGTLGGMESQALGINNARQIVGYATDSGENRHGFLYTGGTIYDLTSLLMPGPGVTVERAYGINSRGQIAGVGIYNNQSVALLLTPVLTPPPQYVVTILGGGSNDGEPLAINDAGQVAGSIGNHAVVWNEATPTFLDAPAGGFNITYGWAVNASGQVVGAAYTAGGAVEGVVWNGTTPTVLGGEGAFAFGINASGQIVGTLLGSNTAVIWNGTTPTALANVRGGYTGEASAINASGQVAGIAGGPVVWNGTIPTLLGDLGDSNVRAINDAGVLVGDSYTTGDEGHAVEWNGTTPTILGPAGSSAYGINNAGEVVGQFSNGDGFLYAGGTIYNLNSLIAPGSGVTVSTGYAINNRGQIAAEGLLGDQYVGLLLTPVSILTPLQSWRYQYYSGIFNTGNATDTADPYSKGIANLPVFAFSGPNQNPATASIAQLPKPQMSGGNYLYSFTEPPGVSGVTYGAEWSATLLSGSWTPIADTGTAPQHTFSVPIGSNTKLFLRLRVTEQ